MSALTEKIWHNVKAAVIDFALTLWSVFDWRNDGFSCADDAEKHQRRWSWLLVSAIVSGAVLRLFLLANEPDLGRDSIYYIGVAEKWALYGWDEVLKPVRYFFVPPCMFWWMKILIQAGVSPHIAGLTVNMIAGISIIPLFYGIARVFFDSRKMGVVAAFLAAFNPVLVDFSTEIMRENFMLSGIGAVLLFTALGFRRNSLYFIGAGFFTVYSILSRTEALEILPLIFLCFALLAIFRVYPLKKILLQMLYFAVGCLAGCIILYFLFGIPLRFYTVNLFRRTQSLLKWIL